jgi:hypothetical protein
MKLEGTLDTFCRLEVCDNCYDAEAIDHNHHAIA